MPYAACSPPTISAGVVARLVERLDDVGEGREIRGLVEHPAGSATGLRRASAARVTAITAAPPQESAPAAARSSCRHGHVCRGGLTERREKDGGAGAPYGQRPVERSPVWRQVEGRRRSRDRPRTRPAAGSPPWRPSWRDARDNSIPLPGAIVIARDPGPGRIGTQEGGQQRVGSHPAPSPGSVPWRLWRRRDRR